MKISAPLIPFALLASSSLASPLEAGHEKRAAAADNCLRAIRGTASIGLPFCSSALNIAQVTSTSYVIAATVTVVSSTTSTSSTTLTTTTGTVTVTAAAQVGKRRTDPTSLISSMCDYDQSRITSACSAYLSGVPTSTTTVLSTTTPTLLTTASATITQTSTISTAATTTVTPLPIITNPGFDDYASDPLHGWRAASQNGCSYAATSLAQSPPFSFVAITPGNVCYVTLEQTLNVVAGKTYTISFQYRSNSAATSNARIQVVIGGVLITITSATSSWQTYTLAPFTATSSSATLSLYLYTSLNQGPESIYVDSFTAALAS